ncbi:2-oxo-4-hydroxy-4-carboxy-5-ureidoimidazoline decarboxylase [Streptomyces sp. NPDC008313]|uniref:2-oxo-4-hydroxy-4-carboxy-5-ureidoimidazoline decarboxylase n=1 Tax=Streptomyces sp. NPDC008313 TaxID=3364826 RepID=UPI0036F05C74
MPAFRFPHLPGQAAAPHGPEQARTAAAYASGLERFNAAAAETVEPALLDCCRSVRWARRLAGHRPYPDLGALLAAADEAAYDLTPADLADALAGESLAALPKGAYSAAHTALGAAQAAYEARFGHVFVICLDGWAPEEALDQVLAAIRSRLGHDREEERVVATEELRRLAGGRLLRLVHAFEECGTRPDPASGADAGAGPAICRESTDSGRPDSPYVPV